MNYQEPQLNSSRRIASVSDIPKIPGYQWTSVQSLRHLIFGAETRFDSKGNVIIAGNGLSSAIIRLGRRVLIDLDAFDTWVLSHRAGEKSDV